MVTLRKVTHHVNLQSPFLQGKSKELSRDGFDEMAGNS